MNATRLLKHYERIADAPDAVARLRRFILDLAVRGKLVPQDLKDEPASKLLTQIAAARSQSGIQQAVVSIEENETPFVLPSGWAWTCIGAVCSKTGSGSTPRGGNFVYKQAGIPFLRSQNVYDGGLRLDDVAYIDEGTHARMSGTVVVANDLLLNITGGSMGRCALVPASFGEANVSQHVAIMRPAVPAIAKFLHRLVLSPYFQTFVFDEQTGAGRAGLPKYKMDRIAVPMPPLAEQQRIVAKVDELIALCDQLDAARAGREARRDRLAAASLARLNVPEPETFHDDARFALDALPSLTARSDQIKQIRQTILGLAVRGALLPPVGGSSKPRRLGEVAKLQNGYAFKSEWFSKTGVRLVRNTNVGHGSLNWTEDARLPDAMSVDYERFQLYDGDVVLSLDRPFIATGTKVARIVEDDLPALLLQRVGRFVVSSELHPAYLFLWITSPHFAEQIDPGRSNGVPHISAKQVEAAVLFLPPLAEQLRIVTKVDELMALCDRLQARLDAGDGIRSRLLDVLLHGALAPALEMMEVA